MQVPAWFTEAKFGVIVHWGPYTVPAFAPIGRTLPELLFGADRAPLARMPYAEWYWNSIRCPGSPAHRYHVRTFGADYDYRGFGGRFREASRAFAPEAWASLFAEASVRYAVLTTKHHDGFLLWPSRRPNPRVDAWYSERDLVGDAAAAFRARGIRFGAYYSGGLDWAYTALPPIRTASEVYAFAPSSAEYMAYALDHFDELIERYRPDLLWNDLSFPARATSPAALFERYLAAVPDGAVNDRFANLTWATRVLAPRITRRLVDATIPRWLPLTAKSDRWLDPLGLRPPSQFHCYEYEVPSEIEQTPWETTRGLSTSFAYNRAQPDDTLLSDEALLHLLLDIVAKNGNLLLGIAVDLDGTVVPAYERALRALGGWLATYGEAVFATRPWRMAAGTARGGEALRYTRRDSTVYVHVLGTLVPGRRIELPADLTGVRDVRLVGRGPVAWRREAGWLAVELPADAPPTPHAYALAVTTAP